MEDIYAELQRIEENNFIDDELLDRVEQVTTIMQGMKEETDQKKEEMNEP